MTAVMHRKPVRNGATTPAQEEPLDTSNIVFKTDWFEIERQDEQSNGEPYYRINAPDAVLILAMTEQSEIVLVKQFRPAIENETLELPAGEINSDETAAEAAARELWEETGYICQELKELSVGRLMASRLNARQYAFFGSGADLDRNYVSQEITDVVLASPTEMKRLVLSGDFQQFAGLALLVLADWRHGTLLTQPDLES